MTRYLGILGYPLAHSISPVMQQAALDYYSLDIDYEAWHTPPQELTERVSRLRDKSCLGANVTIPHKESVYQLLDDCDPWSSRVGAVNTIVNDNGRLVGHNTDSEGFLKAIRERLGVDLRDSQILLLGAGGAARAAAFALCHENISSLTIANRKLERAQALVNDVQKDIPSTTAIPIEDTYLGRSARVADLIVNATSIGMSHGGNEGRSPLSADHIQPGTTVFDMVYTPTETALLAETRKAGALGLGGLWMLVYQGASGFELWTGKIAPVDIMYRAAETALGEMNY